MLLQTWMAGQGGSGDAGIAGDGGGGCGGGGSSGSRTVLNQGRACWCLDSSIFCSSFRGNYRTMVRTRFNSWLVPQGHGKLHIFLKFPGN